MNRNDRSVLVYFGFVNLLALCVVLTGCNLYKSVKPSVVVRTATTESLIPTNAITSATQVQVPVSSPTLTPTAQSGTIEIQCITINPKPAGQLPGILVMENLVRENLKNILFLDLETNQGQYISPPGGDRFLSENTSSGGSYFSTRIYSTLGPSGFIKIYDRLANLVTQVPLEQPSEYFWLNDEQFLMNAPNRDDNSVLLVSPFESPQRQELLEPYLPDYNFVFEPLLEWGYFGSF